MLAKVRTHECCCACVFVCKRKETLSAMGGVDAAALGEGKQS